MVSGRNVTDGDKRLPCVLRKTTTATRPDPMNLPSIPCARRAFVCLPLAIVFAGIFLCGFSARADVAEYELKAAFVYNFVQYCKWPANAFDNPSSPLVIGILGDDPFGGALEKALRGKDAGGRKITVKRSHNVDSLKGCQALFVSKSEGGQAAQIIAAMQGTPVLTVGDMEQFARQGGIINFTIEGDKVRFEINRGAAGRAGLKLSSDLLKFAIIVG